MKVIKLTESQFKRLIGEDAFGIGSETPSDINNYGSEVAVKGIVSSNDGDNEEKYAGATHDARADDLTWQSFLQRGSRPGNPQ